MAADILGSTSSANSPYLQFFDSRARYSIVSNRTTFQKTCIYTKPALRPSFQPSYLNTFQLCSLTCPEGTQFTHPSRTQGKPSVYHLRATRTPSHLHTLTPSNFRTLKSQVSPFRSPLSGLLPQVSGLFPQLSGLPFQVSPFRSPLSSLLPHTTSHLPASNKQPTTPTFIPSNKQLQPPSTSQLPTNNKKLSAPPDIFY